MVRCVLCLVQAFLFTVSSFSVLDSNFKEWVDDAALNINSTKNLSFDSLTAQQAAPSQAEKEQCRSWYSENILYAGQNGKAPAYAFTVGGKSLRKNLNDWTFRLVRTTEPGEIYRGGETSYIEVAHKNSGLVFTVEATLYAEQCTCEWVVSAKNTDSKNSPVLKNFYAADVVLPLHRTALYLSKGSDPAANDFEMHKSYCNFIPMRFNANGGRSESYLPYFNLSGQDGGVVFATGWTGQWFTSVAQCRNGVRVWAKQEYFEAYLTPGETVRSPRVTMTFYSGNNALKGFNLFRRFEMDCLYTESANALTTAGLCGEFSNESAEELIAHIREMPQSLCDQTNYVWMDAGWYPKPDNWYSNVGTWSPDPVRFPNGLAPIAEAAQERGMQLLLWYEPERCCKGTTVYEEAVKHEGWLIEKSDTVNLVNLANDDACAYLANLVANSIRENKVGLYRQDFNFTPFDIWRDADKTYYGGRVGIEENHYVTNLYVYLDTLLRENPGLLIDNCASGGKRLDIEMTRRSIPLWRSDYNCRDEEGNAPADIVEATQAHTFGLSFWLPLHGTGNMIPGEYAIRSEVIPCAQKAGYADVREFMTQDYYPLTGGGTDTKKILAMQYGQSDAMAGVAMIYCRENVRENSYRLRLNGLDPDKTYELRDYDCETPICTITGEKLVRDGVLLNIPQTPKAMFIMYRVTD